MATPTKHTGDSQYPEVSYAELGSWDPTLNDSSEESPDLYVVKNLRQETPGQYVTRSGYHLYTYTLVTANAIIYSKAEYDIPDNTGLENSFDVTLYYDEGKVSVLLLNKTTKLPVDTIQLKLEILTGLGSAPEMAASMQYESYLYVTIYNHGNYLIFPNSQSVVQSTNPSDWTILDVGKNLAPTPTGQSLPVKDTTTGDILVRQSHNSGGHQILDYQPGQQEPPIIRLPLNTDYWLADDASKFFQAGFKKWEWSVNDPSNWIPTTLPGNTSSDHLQTRAWGYRAVLVQQFVNTKGEKFTYRSQASVDWWVPNRYYSPAYAGARGTDPSVNPKGTFLERVDNESGIGHGFWMGYPSQEPLGNGEYFGFPPVPGFTTVQPWYILQKAYRKYFHGTENIESEVGTQDPFYFTAKWLGWLEDANEAHNGGTMPYVIPVSAYDLKQAPMTILTWDDFALLPNTNPNPDFPSNTIKIEIYRTAFNGKSIENVTAQNTAGSPLFQPHLYGYVGTIEENGTFTDDVKDTAINFGKTPEQYDGYLIGQYSGKVLREYSDKVVTGNIVSNYEVFKPSPVQHSIAAILGDPATIHTITTADINNKYKFFFQYEDADGNVSDLQEVPIDVSDTGAVTSHIAFKIPWGYDPNIVKVNIVLHSVGGVPVDGYYLMNSLDTKSGYVTIEAADVDGATVPYTTIEAVTKQTKEPGGVLYSNPNAMFETPFTNVEIVHKFAPVTAMETITGPLWIWTDRSLTLTTLNPNQLRTEEETKQVGNIGYNTSGSNGKSNKIVFFLSANGLQYAEASGIVPFPTHLQQLVLTYLDEEIPGLPALANARRASLAYLGQRDELWLHFPASADLYPGVYDSDNGLPERTFIYKLWNGNPSTYANYEFELINPLDLVTHDIVNPVVLRSHTDGSLYSSYVDPVFPAIFIMDNDSVIESDAWMGATYLEKRYTLNEPGKKKKLRAVSVRAGGKCQAWFVTGRPYFTDQPVLPHTPDYLGEIYNDGTIAVSKYEAVKNSTTTNAQLLKHRTNGSSIETTAYIPAVRLVTQPDADGDNSVVYYGVTTFLTMEDHP